MSLGDEIDRRKPLDLVKGDSVRAGLPKPDAILLDTQGEGGFGRHHRVGPARPLAAHFGNKGGVRCA